MCGDCRTILPTLDSNSIDCIVTSPPYWQKRDYGCDQQIGQEETLAAHIDHLVELFGECRRILKPTGTFWLNYGDSWAPRNFEGIKRKDLVGAPWRLAFALRDDGWWLRDSIIWHKPNTPPNPAWDRTCPCHEYIFMLTKGPRYHYDYTAIEEPISPVTVERGQSAILLDRLSHLSVKEQKYVRQKLNGGTTGMKGLTHIAAVTADKTTRRKKSVWSITVGHRRGDHEATFPRDLVKPCILAGCPAGGVVLDPFAGSGTTGEVARSLGRRAILVESNENYAVDMRRRIGADLSEFFEYSLA